MTTVEAIAVLEGLRGACETVPEHNALGLALAALRQQARLAARIAQAGEMDWPDVLDRMAPFPAPQNAPGRAPDADAP